MTFLAKLGLERDDMSLGKIRRGEDFSSRKKEEKGQGLQLKTSFKRANSFRWVTLLVVT